ncbi:MFS general substrate transporter [Polychaeton citri CBS 116435]|uniref:MFS general substrate transporter n=1 Tax=Polychaeton citri CBS 116435 TaxID=1314669 RepID=A0A9P4Q8N1_9PEZI|nr:MFS general substrate transporter [Polychaeton citri CBS 116435]
MQSLLQHRRLRAEVREDLSRSRRAISSASPTASTRTSNSEPALDYDTKETDVEDPVEPHLVNGAPTVPGVTVSHPEDSKASFIFVVGWRENDPNNPKDWSLGKKWLVIATTCIITASLTIPTSVEAPAQDAFDAHFEVNDLAGSMTTGIFLIGVAVGSLFSGPFSETFGRNAVYISTMIVVMLFIMAKALAPNYGAAIAFRFLSALFAAAPMTVMGGTIGDILTPEQLPWGLPFTTFTAYSGPILGPVIGAYTPKIGFAWADWISMILIGASLVLAIVVFPETYSPVLLEWKAKHLRDQTGDSRYHAVGVSGSLGSRLLTNVYRPFTMIWTEPIILVFSFYLVLLYTVLFAFLNGYPYIFQYPYGISTGLTFIIFAAMMPGVGVALALIPLMLHLTKKAAARARAVGQTTPPEVSLYWSMAGASILMPISLFWMAWTCYSSVSIWSPIVASGVFGYSLVCIFTTSYMYIISVYRTYAASALGFMTFSRYLISGALIPGTTKMYQSIGPHYSLTIVAIVASFMAPVPFVLYKHGSKLRAMSKNAQNKE